MQTSKMESFATIVNGWKPLPIVAKVSIFDIYGGLVYASASHYHYPSLPIWNFDNITRWLKVLVGIV